MSKRKSKKLSPAEVQAATHRRELVEAYAVAERLAAAILDHAFFGTFDEEGKREVALFKLHSLLLDESGAIDDDEKHGRQLMASEDSAFLLGLAIGRLTPGSRAVGSARGGVR